MGFVNETMGFMGAVGVRHSSHNPESELKFLFFNAIFLNLVEKGTMADLQ